MINAEKSKPDVKRGVWKIIFVILHQNKFKGIIAYSLGIHWNYLSEAIPVSIYKRAFSTKIKKKKLKKVTIISYIVTIIIISTQQEL